MKTRKGAKKKEKKLSLQFFEGVRKEDNAKECAKVMQSPAAPLDYFSKCIITDPDIEKEEKYSAIRMQFYCVQMQNMQSVDSLLLMCNMNMM